MVIVAYFHNGVGLNEENLTILDNIAAVVLTVKKPFVILADWNVEPEAIGSSGWLRAVGGSVVATGQPTFKQAGAASELDYAFVSWHWAHAASASVFDLLPLTPHSAVALTIPAKLPQDMVRVVRKPSAFPA